MASKLCRLFNLRPHFELIDKIVDYQNKLFHYHYRCSLYRLGEFVGECDAIANTQEKRYKSQINSGNLSVINTVVKMAQKRAFVGATLVACCVSMYFTQDLDDYDNTNTKNDTKTKTKTDTKAITVKTNQSKGEISKEEYERRFKN